MFYQREPTTSVLNSHINNRLLILPALYVRYMWLVICKGGGVYCTNLEDHLVFFKLSVKKSVVFCIWPFADIMQSSLPAPKWHLRNLASICHLLPVLPLVFAAKLIVHIMMAKYFCHAIYQTQIYHGSRGCYLFCQIVVYSSAWNSRQEGSWANFLNLPLQALYFNIWSHSLFI